MKNLLLILLFVSTILNAQALQLIYGGETPKWAIDVATDEYGYDNSVTGLDLNGSELITATADRDFSGAGHWTGITVSGGVGTFTATASLAAENHTTWIAGHNYTLQADMKSAGVLGSELLSGDNNNFTNGVGSWIGVRTSITELNDQLVAVVTSNTSYPIGIMAYNKFVIGNYYSITYDVKSNDVDTKTFYEGDAVGAYSELNVNSTYQTFSNVFLATTTTCYLGFSSVNINIGDSIFFDNISIKQVTYSSFKFVTDNDSSTITTTGISSTKAFTFTYSGGSQTVQLKGIGSDTWTADNISVTEAYDLEVEAWIKTNTNNCVIANTRLLNNNGWYVGDDNANGLAFYTYSSVANTGVYSSDNSMFDGNWHLIKVVFSQVGNVKFYKDNALLTTKSYTLNKKNTNSTLTIGKMSDASSGYINGQVGEIKITRKNGTGAVISTSIYDWEGTSATFLNDKGTNGNNLTGVNVTTADQVKYSTGKYK